MKQSNGMLSLGEGYRISAPGISGQVELLPSGSTGSRRGANSAGRGYASLANQGFAALESALATSSLEVRSVVVHASAVAPLGRVDQRAGAMAGTFHLHVPQPPARQHAVVLAVDEAGTATWHFPRAAATPAAAAAGRPVLEFEVPYRVVPPPVEGFSAQGVGGWFAGKLLKVVFYKAADVAVGKVGEYLVSRWEEKNRPTRLRWFTADHYRDAGADVVTDPGQLADLRGKRALLFLHGTFSTSHGGFGGIAPKVMARLWDQYEHRVLAFDHATMASSPEVNLDRLVKSLPPTPGITFDVVAHSRGGLVARGLAGEFGSEPPGLKVRRAIFVGTPNHGTALADVAHITALLERMTNALSSIPPVGPVGAVAETLETVIAGVKFVGASVASRLDGLMAMDPTSPFMAQLNQGPPPTAEYFGVSSNFEPTEPGLLALVRDHIVDTTVDYVFGQEANDLVVPQLGVSQGPPPDDPVFPLPKSRLKSFGTKSGVWHCSYFDAPATSARILQWLDLP